MFSYVIPQLIVPPIAVLCGILLLIGAMQYRKIKKPWVTISLYLAGAIAILYGGSGIFLVVNKAEIGTEAYLKLKQARPLLGGIGAGILITLLISKELIPKSKSN